MEYPYQIVAFLDTQPEKGQLIYGDESGGWLAQVALKRRFALKNPDTESNFITQMRDYYAAMPTFEIKTGQLEKPERMPVEIISIPEPSAATKFHYDFLKRFGEVIASKYPEREGDNYFPHITAQYWDKYVIDPEKYESKIFNVSAIWLVKDGPNEQDTRTLEDIALHAG